MLNRPLPTVILFTALLGLLGAAIWWRAQPPPAAYVNLAKLAARPDIVAAISNANTGPAFDLHARDVQWRKQVAGGLQGPLIRDVMASALSRQLVLDRLESDGQIDQIMVMDARGALVAADAPTHDYDQSDEPKWQRTVGAQIKEPVYEGSDSETLGKVDQMSQAVVSPEGRIIGAVLLRWCRTKGGCT